MDVKKWKINANEFPNFRIIFYKYWLLSIGDRKRKQIKTNNNQNKKNKSDGYHQSIKIEFNFEDIVHQLKP